MLVEFRVRNYGCFRDEQILSMVASSDDSLPDNTIASQGRNKLSLLRSAVVYGPNASGKSKLLEALHYMRRFVLRSFREQGDGGTGVTPFLFDDNSASSPSAFEVTFIRNEVRYQYGFEVDRKRVHREFLYAAPKGYPAILFTRSWNAEIGAEEYYFGSSLKGQREKTRDMTMPNTLFLSVAKSVGLSALPDIYDWFRDGLRGLFAARIGSGMSRLIQDQSDWLEQHREGIKKLLKVADLGVADFRTLEEPIPDDVQKAFRVIADQTNDLAPQRWFRIQTAHEVTAGQFVYLDLEDESQGTLQLFELAPYFLDALAEGQAFVVDELDASMHPLLVHALVELFHNPVINQHNAQLIFNTHDTTLLDRELFRRDQIWFTEKGQDGAAHLYSLAEYRPRKDEAWGKGYLQGRYGAIPFLGDFPALLPEEQCE